MWEWISNISDGWVSAAAAIGSFVVALFALFYSYQAKKAADTANAHSGKANELAGKANEVSIRANEVSVLANDHAEEAVKKADVANRISLHTHQKELYVAFNRLTQHINEKRQALDMFEVAQFHPYSLTAHFYFQQSLAGNIKAWFDACFWMAERQQQLELEKEWQVSHQLADPYYKPSQEDADRIADIQRAQNAHYETANKLKPVIIAGLDEHLSLV